jgi:nucleoside-diphosphate-sugar epimerase
MCADGLNPRTTWRLVTCWPTKRAVGETHIRATKIDNNGFRGPNYRAAAANSVATLVHHAHGLHSGVAQSSGEPMMTVDSSNVPETMYFSIEKARRELGYSPRPAVEALRDEIEWFYKHGYVG